MKRIAYLSALLCMVFLAVFAAADESPATWPGEFGGSRYLIVHESLTWQEAADRCTEMGGHLLTITSREENDYIVSILPEKPLNCYWTGMYQISDGTWLTVTGEKADYFNWAPNEPNNMQAEAYVHIFGVRYTGGKGIKEPGQWNDADPAGAEYAADFYALGNFGFICEWEIEEAGDVPTDDAAASTAALPVSSTGDAQGFTVVHLGVYESVVSNSDGEHKTVRTSSLAFSGEIPAEKAIAVIHAPDTGKCTLREKASTSARALGKCKAGTVVAVLEYGKKFCRISYQGEVGWVLTSCLKFYGDAQAPIGAGMLTWKGQTSSDRTINIRNTADSGSSKVAEWPVGLSVTVFSKNGKWYEIEHEGVHGFVHEDYLMLIE